MTSPGTDDAKDAWLWQNTAFSDVTMLVYPAGDGPDGAWTSDKPEPLAKLPLHASVLASASPEHLRGHLLRLWQEKLASAASIPGPVPASGSNTDATGAAGTEEEPEAKRAKVSGSWIVAGNMLELVCQPGEPEAAPEAVLHHVYTGILPDDPLLLAWMVWRADYLDMHATVEACLAKLKAMADQSKLTLDALVVVSNLPALQTDSRATMEQQVAHMADKVLPARFGNARRLAGVRDLLKPFAQLPFQLLKHWATLGSIEAESENTIAVLITAWYNHQLSSTPATAAPTEQQCKELSALIRLDKLSPSFHLQALPHLKWYRAPATLPQQHAVMRVLAGLDASIDKAPYQAALSSGGATRQVNPTRYLEWSLTNQKLKELWEGRAVNLGHFSFWGFEFTTRLQLEVAPSGADGTMGQRSLSLSISLAWPSVLRDHGVGDKVPNPVTALGLACEVSTAKWAGDVFLCGEVPYTWQDVGGQKFSCMEELALFMAPSNLVAITSSTIR